MQRNPVPGKCTFRARTEKGSKKLGDPAGSFLCFFIIAIAAEKGNGEVKTAFFMQKSKKTIDTFCLTLYIPATFGFMRSSA